MKIMITAIVAGGALLVSAAPAQAAPARIAAKDPVSALKARLVPGHGVRFTDTTTVKADDGDAGLLERTGTFQFSRKGIAASDITAKWSAGTGREDEKPERTISIGKVSYDRSEMWKDKMPPGKTWYRSRGLPGGGGGFYGQVINPAEPGTLAVLLKKGKRSGATLKGTITFKELAKVSPWFDASVPIRSDNAAKVSYAVTFDGSGLAAKVTSSYPANAVLDTSGMDGKTLTIESRFTGWGRKVSVKAPDPGTVTTKVSD
ncbi:hypothetical protein [Nonomuraea roseoviolacea]|uniref:LppX_LprAFG lipoprotein n=1 Tax=Nonomuraea roseoviolacea subsp. carminata TaxID=160689 RepID=A0ABT1K8W5_9ACTN|nr:hypothetical protein [Nonomuraea roseoviolacea]MCP2350461.1 hypothetical protein [Nonomuraea roseoviolacea subsp. carminata]